MNIILTGLLMLFSTSIFAGYYSSNGYIDTYDSASGLYYKSLSIERENKGFMSNGTSPQVTNVNIYNPITQKSKLLFKRNKKRQITFMIFESSISDGKVEFNDSSYFNNIKNNKVGSNRELKNKFLIGVLDKDGKSAVLWTADKNGENLATIATVLPSEDWHIDVKNSKLRIISSSKGRFKIRSYDW